MKILFIILLMPLFSIGQTVHVKDEAIVYEGKEKIKGATASEIFTRVQKKLPLIISNYEVKEQSANTINARGEMRLKTPYNLIRTVNYSFKITAVEEGYEYVIDSVSFTEKVRGEKPVTKSSKEVLKNMGETGKIVGDTEKLLNETDMRFQNILAVLKSTATRKDMQ